MAAGVVLIGPLWTALTCATRFRAANLLAYLPLPGGLALTCTALYCIYLTVTWIPHEEKLLYLTLSLFHFFYSKFCLKKNLWLDHQYYTNSIFNSPIIIWLKAKSFNVKLFLDIANENKIKYKTASKNICLFNTNRCLLLFYFTFLFSHLSDAFIQIDLQIRKSN